MARAARAIGQADDLAYARSVLRAEADALRQVAQRIDDGLVDVARHLAQCSGRVAVTGVGKPADIARKIVGTFNSTGTRAYFLDAAASMHGDLGAVHPDDVALILSHSGASDEIRRLVPPLRELCSRILAITGNEQGWLARAADAAIVYGSLAEACPLALAPSTSTTVMIALGDALAFTLSRRRGLTAQEFARYHPGGSLGRQLAAVEAYMRSGPAVRVARADETVRNVFSQGGRLGRRTGAIMLLDSSGRLSGIFTDSDLARLFARRGDACLDRPIREIMTRNPWTVRAGSRLLDALEVMRTHKISELPIVDADEKPIGLLDITDLLELMPSSELGFEPEERASSSPRHRRSA
jgi:arabinose-5-phosphate isomerase